MKKAIVAMAILPILTGVVHAGIPDKIKLPVPDRKISVTQCLDLTKQYHDQLQQYSQDVYNSYDSSMSDKQFKYILNESTRARNYADLMSLYYLGSSSKSTSTQRSSEDPNVINITMTGVSGCKAFDTKNGQALRDQLKGIITHFNQGNFNIKNMPRDKTIYTLKGDVNKGCSENSYSSCRTLDVPLKLKYRKQ